MGSFGILKERKLFRRAYVIYLFVRFSPCPVNTAAPLMQAKFSWPFGYRINGFQCIFERKLNTENVIEEEENCDMNSV